MDDEEIRKMSKSKFKQLVQTKINEFAKKCALAIQSKQSKTSKIEIYEKRKTAGYLLSKNLCKEEKQTLFRLRSRTIDVKLKLSNPSSNFFK